MIRNLILTTLLSLAALASYGQGDGLLGRSYTPSRQTASVNFFLDEIARQTGVEISYSETYLRARRRLTLPPPPLTIRTALSTLLEGTGLQPLVQEGRLLLIPGAETPQKKEPVLSGFIRDSASREVVIGAIIYAPGVQRGTTTNAFGFYSLELPAGNHQVIVTAGGYQPDTLQMLLGADLRRDVLLSYGLRLTGVTISSRQQQRSDLTRLSRSELSQHAGLLGENDPLRGLQYTSGVMESQDGNSNLVVRGGDPGQNLYLLDGVPLYYIDHMSGLTSVYNTDAVKSVDFYKGGFPSRYAGRLSSIVDVSSRDGDMKRFGGQASLGLLKGNLSLEGPIVKDKASVSLTARRTWVDLLWRPLFEDRLKADFYDVNLKANWIIDPKNRIYLSGYNGRDQIRDGLSRDLRTRWGNSVASFRWTSALRPNLFLNTSLTYSRFRYDLESSYRHGAGDTARIYYNGASTVEDASLRVQADYYRSAEQHLQIGLLVSRLRFKPSDIRIYQDAPRVTTPSADPFSVTELSFYVEDQWKVLPSLDVSVGMHASSWLQNASSNFFSLQPRLSLDYRLARRSTLYASAARMSQFLHQLNNETTFYPSDFWVPSTAVLQPEHAWTAALGYTFQAAKRTRLKAEVYYKQLDKVIAYRSGTNIFESPIPWDLQLVQGEGRSYGLETEVHQQLGPVRADIAYTLSRTTRRFDDLNNGKTFPFRYDRRNCVKASVLYQRRARFNAIAEYTYMSGEAITVPDQLYPDYDRSLNGWAAGDPFTYQNAARNNYRLPPIQRLDLAVNFIKTRARHFERTWTLGVYNFLANRNYIGASVQQSDNGGYKLVGVTYFQFVPTVSYAVRF